MAVIERDLQTRFVGNPLDFGADPLGLEGCSAALLATEWKYPSAVLPPGIWRVTQNLTLSVRWSAEGGAKIRPDPGVTVTLPASFRGSPGCLDISLGGSFAFSAAPEWFEDSWFTGTDEVASAATAAVFSGMPDALTASKRALSGVFYDNGGSGCHLRHRRFGGHTLAVDGSADWTSVLEAASAAVLDEGAGLIVGPGVYWFAANATCEAPFTPQPGCMIRPASGVTVTFNGPVTAGPYQWIDLSLGGSVVWTNTERVLPQWTGSDTDGVVYRTPEGGEGLVIANDEIRSPLPIRAPNTDALDEAVGEAQEALLDTQLALNAVQAALSNGIIGVVGGEEVSPEVLKSWTVSELYEPTSVTYNDVGVATAADIVWPDGSAGVFTSTDINLVWLAVDGYTITHEGSGQTVTQAAVTRNGDGAIIAKPALTVS